MLEGEKEVKVVSFGMVLKWIFIVLFYALGVYMLFTGFRLYGLIIIILNTFLIKAFSKVTKKLGFEFSHGLKVVFVIIILALIYLWLRASGIVRAFLGF